MKYDFQEISRQIITTLTKAADDQIAEAQNLRASVQVLAEGIEAMMAEHAKLLNSMDDRLHTFGNSVVEAHRMFLNGGKHENPSP
jgi:hypothetical protein